MTLFDSAEASLLDLLFLNVDFANIGDAAGLQNSATAGSLFVSLHTADPGEAGTQATNEATYGSYARIAVARAAGGWNRTANVMSNTAAINFAEATSGSETMTHAAIGGELSGAGTPIVSGALTASLAVSTGIAPFFAIGDLDFTLE